MLRKSKEGGKGEVGKCPTTSPNSSKAPIILSSGNGENWDGKGQKPKVSHGLYHLISSIGRGKMRIQGRIVTLRGVSTPSRQWNETLVLRGEKNGRRGY